MGSVSKTCSANMIHELIRELRQKRGLTEQQLADIAGFSKGLISQIETEKTAPTIPTLHKIVSALGLSLGEFFFMLDHPEGELITGRVDDSERVEDKTEATPLMAPQDCRGFFPSIFRLKPGQTLDFGARQGKEFWYLIEGKVKVKIGPRKLELAKGEYLSFSTVLGCGAVNLGEEPAVVLRIESMELS